jgi:hypothetical protein
LFIATTLAATSPFLQPPWHAMTSTDPAEYARYERTEPDGTTSVVIAARHHCTTCQPATTASFVVNQLAAYPGVTAKVDESTMCGQKAQRLLATGIARPDMPYRRNSVAYFFRQGEMMYNFTYTFTSPAPLASAEAALSALCPAY